MKSLSNPWVSGGLAAVAVLVVGYQIFSPRLKLGMPAPAPVAVVPPAPSAAVAPLPPMPPAGGQALTQAVIFLPTASIDLSYGETYCRKWADNPDRDPFRLQLVRSGTTNRSHSSLVAGWALKSIWSQTGSRVAAINQRVYAAGDTIEGYKVKTIDADRVWFEGPDGLEVLGFKGRLLSPAKPGSTSK